MFAWLDTKDAIAQGKETARSVCALFARAETGGSARKDGKIQEKFDRLVEGVALAVRGRRFNLYQKARFGNTLKWGLREAGYPDEFIDELVTLLLVRIR